jgi:hypothetical protein
VAHETSLIPPIFIEVPVPSQECERLCIFVRGNDFASFYDFCIGKWNCGIFYFSFNCHKRRDHNSSDNEWCYVFSNDKDKILHTILHTYVQMKNNNIYLPGDRFIKVIVNRKSKITKDFLTCTYVTGHYQNTRTFSCSYFGDIKYFCSNFALAY